MEMMSLNQIYLQIYNFSPDFWKVSFLLVLSPSVSVINVFCCFIFCVGFVCSVFVKLSIFC